ncbi:receptor-like protein kinase [Trifolium medium]|uniref:Receptor-like protein kinase n=1 Tax=Trifolium medium TaxID=97028 RepID=A0A392N0K2_9FABA|nr:receptor-like protein kinase [Trifolium medium]
MAVQQTSAAATLAHIGNSTACISHSVGSWILDSGASDHVVGNPSLIMLPPKIPHNITLTNGSKAQVTGIGQTSPLPSLSLNYVLFVPSSPFNLISISKLALSLNCSATFCSDSFFIQDQRTGKTIATGSESQGLYYLHPHPSTICSVSTSPDIIHRRLGHPSLDKLKVLVPQLSHLKTLCL